MMANHYVSQFMRPGYEPGDGSMDGAMLVDAEWWHPVFGCDSLQHVFDNVRYRRVLQTLTKEKASVDPAPQPVPVSERLPGPGDCDAEGRCWIYLPDIGTDPSWRLADPRDIGPYHTHWLPAHALPLPRIENNFDG